jgi:arginase
MNICLIQVPYTMGDERPGTSKGPERLVQAGVSKLIAAKGLEVSVERVDRGEPFRDGGNASLIVSKRLAGIVRQAIAANHFPLVLAGGCDVSKGILSGFDHGQCGVVWFDAHGDFNTPESGYFDGMSVGRP